MRNRLLRKICSSAIAPLALLSASGTPQAASADECHDVLTEERERDHLFELCEAAEQGDAGAMYWLGLAYIEGVLLNDYDRGLAWLKKASFAGNEQATRLYEFISSAEIGPGC